MNLVAEIHARLSVLSPQLIELNDDSALHAGHVGAKSGGGHWRLLIVSTAFEGLSAVARHRAVYTALGDLFSQQHIHALALVTRTPQESVK